MARPIEHYDAPAGILNLEALETAIQQVAAGNGSAGS